MKKLIVFIITICLIPTLLWAGSVEDVISVIARKNAVGGTWYTAWEVTDACTGATTNGSIQSQARAVINSADTTASGSKIRITFEARSNASADPYEVECVYLGARSSGDVMSSITEVTFNTGQSGFTISSDGGTIVSDEITFSFDSATTYLIHQEDLDATISSRYWPDSSDTECATYYDSSTPTPCSDTLDLASDGTHLGIWGIKIIEVFN